ncbi:MAG: quinoprotein relay system zinc metallohydrolase 1 [Burkholderiales bacterium]
MRALVALLAALGAASAVFAAAFDYELAPQKIADGTYVLTGRTEDFSTANGGNVANAAFIVTSAGVVVIDTGPSRRYGEQLRAAIRKVTNQPVVKVLNTHFHPDHFLGNQAFADVGISALPATIRGIESMGGAFADNMYRMCGDWEAGTEPLAPRHIQAAGVESIGGHVLEFLALGGHSDGDLVVFDRTTEVLFTGDLVFFERAATTPHARIDVWLDALARLQALPYKLLVPGHGPVVSDARAIEQTRDYLVWLQATLEQAAERGEDMTEAMAMPIPEKFAAIPLVHREFARSVTHLYPALEQKALGAPR